MIRDIPTAKRRPTLLHCSETIAGRATRVSAAKGREYNAGTVAASAPRPTLMLNKVVALDNSHRLVIRVCKFAHDTSFSNPNLSRASTSNGLHSS